MSDFVVIQPIVVCNVDRTSVKVIAIRCTEDEYIEWVKFQRMTHSQIIPDFYLNDYLSKKGISIPHVWGEGNIPDGKLNSNTFLEKVGNTVEVFVSINRVKEILRENNLSYDEFIDAYAAYLKSL